MKIDPELEKIIVDYFDEFYYRFSSYATERGVHRYDYKICSLRRYELTEWWSFVSNSRKELYELKNKKNIEKTMDFQLLDSMLSEESKQSLELYSFKSDINFFISCILRGLTSVGFGSYNSIGIRSRSFTSRLNDIGNVKLAIEEIVQEINMHEKSAAINDIVFLRNFIEVFSSYLMNKSDIEKKDEVRAGKDAGLTSLKEIEDLLGRLNLVPYYSLEKSIKRFNYEEFPMKDISKSLTESLSYVRDSVIRKAREINIIAPYVETLHRALDSLEELTESDVLEMFEKVKSSAGKKFPESKLQIDFRKIPKELESSSYFLKDFYSVKFIPTGEFDGKRKLSVVLQAQENRNLLLINLIENGVPGIGLLKEIRARSPRMPRKYFFNRVFEPGYKIYSRREMVEDLKYDIGREFELLMLYREYLTTLSALVENEILFGRFNEETLNNLVYSNELVFDKKQFLDRIFAEEGESLLGMHGLYNIIELRKQFGGRMKLNDFHYKLLANSHLPFRLLRQVL